MVWAATVVAAVGDVTRLALPVLVTLTVHTAGDGVPCGALPMARAVIGAGINPSGVNIHTTHRHKHTC